MDAPPTKKQKIEDSENDNLNNFELDGFRFERILMNDVKSKRIVILGRYNI